MALRKVLVAAVAAVAISIAVSCGVGVYHRSRYHARHGRYPPLGLHAEVAVSTASIGIPGITKLYEATLVNYGLLPVRVTVCNFIDDTLSRGVGIAYGIERWNAVSRTWEVVVEANAKSFCRPYPLGIVEAHVRRVWLWPGQHLSAGEEATAARGPFQKGDKARFVLLADIAGIDKRTSAFRTTAFDIDEEVAAEDVPFRVRH